LFYGRFEHNPAWKQSQIPVSLVHPIALLRLGLLLIDFISS
jgi:hypothetical protein